MTEIEPDKDMGRVARAAGILRNATKKNNKSDGRWSTIAALSPDEMETMMENFAAEDSNSSKTWSRYVVENFLMDVSHLAENRFVFVS